MIGRNAAIALGAVIVGGTTGAASVQPLTRTLYYQVSAVNSAGEGPRSNELSVTFTEPLSVFQQFVTDSQAAAYYKKWVAANPFDAGRWASFRDQILAASLPLAPTMTTKYGAALVDAGIITIYEMR